MPTKIKPKISSNYFSLSKSVLVKTFLLIKNQKVCMLSMNKVISFALLFFFITSSITVAFNPVSASDLTDDSWSTKTPMSQARASLGVVAVDGKIYAIGGQADDGSVGTNERYDPKTDTWTTLKPMPTPRHSFAIAAYEGKIYCIGGVTGTSDQGYAGTSANEVYDIVTDSWNTKVSLPINGSGLQAHVIDGNIFVLAGLDLFMYSPVTDVWTNRTGITEDPEKWTVYSYSSCLVNGKIIVFCKFAYFRFLHPYSSYQKTMIYDPKTDTWDEQKKETMDITGTVLCATTGHYAPQRIYAIGVRWLADNTQQPFTSVYDYKNDKWSTAKSMSTNRDWFGVVVFDDIVYVIGGLIIGMPADDAYGTRSTEYLTLNEQYVPIGYGSVTRPNPSIITTLIVGIITTSLFFYLKKRKKDKLKVIVI